MREVLFFLHIPKTAGTTLNAVLEANFPPESVLSVYDKASQQRMESLTAEEFQALRLIQGHVFVRDFEQFFSQPLTAFTMLREPVARVVSEYDFLRSWPEHHLYHYLNKNRIGIADYVAGESKELRRRGKNLMCNSLAGSAPPCKDEAETLERAKANLERFAVVGLTEMFDATLLLLQEAAGLQNVLYERRNIRAGVLKPQDLSPGELEVVREHNRLDMELYAHAKTRIEEEVARRGANFQKRLKHFQEINRRYQAISEKVLLKSGVRQEAKGWSKG